MILGHLTDARILAALAAAGSFAGAARALALSPCHGEPPAGGYELLVAGGGAAHRSGGGVAGCGGCAAGRRRGVARGATGLRGTARAGPSCLYLTAADAPCGAGLGRTYDRRGAAGH